MDIALEQALATFHDNGHSLLSPSGWEGWSRCTGMLVGLDESRKTATDNEASIEGTTAHMLLELAILTWTSPLECGIAPYQMEADAGEWYMRIKTNDNNTSEVKAFAEQCYLYFLHGTYPDDMRHEVEKCYQRIKAYRDDGWEVTAESKVSLEPMFGHKHCDGTSDVIMTKGRSMVIVDLKYGKGIEVSPVKSGQLSLYGGGALCGLPADRVIDDIQLVIMQPRIGNGVWKSWSISINDLMLFLDDAKGKSIIALKVLAGIKGEVVKFDPNDKSCMWCHRKRDCKARMDFAMQSVADAFNVAGVVADSNVIDHEVSNKAISEVLDRSPFIISFLNDMAEEAQKRAIKGEQIPGRKLVKGRAARKWDDPETIEALLLKHGVSPMDFVKATICSPAQMDKVKLTDEQKVIVKKSTQFTYGKNALVLNTDSRMGVADEVASAFEKAGVVKVNLN